MSELKKKNRWPRRPWCPDRNPTDPQPKEETERFLEGVSVTGQTGDKRQQSPKKYDFLSRLIGNSNVSRVDINGRSARALIDSGSQIKTILEEFYNSLDPKPNFIDIGEFNLKIEAAGGNSVPYSGCIRCLLQVPFLGGHVIAIGALVVPTTDYNLEVPVIVGTSAIEVCRKVCVDTEGEIPLQWKNAFISLQQINVGTVKSTNKTDIQIQPMETVTLSGLLRKKHNVETAITEQNEGASTKIGVCPRVVSLNKNGTDQRVIVKMFNISYKVLTVKPKTPLCE